MGDALCTHSKRTRSKESSEEATYQESLQVFGDSDGDVEDREAERGNDERQASALEFRQRSPQNWSSCKTGYTLAVRVTDLGSILTQGHKAMLPMFQ